jgi:hypothetical protein
VCIVNFHIHRKRNRKRNASTYSTQKNKTCLLITAAEVSIERAAMLSRRTSGSACQRTKLDQTWASACQRLHSNYQKRPMSTLSIHIFLLLTTSDIDNYGVKDLMQDEIKHLPAFGCSLPP